MYKTENKTKLHYAYSSMTHSSNRPKDKRNTRTRSSFIHQASRKHVKPKQDVASNNNRE